MQYRTVLLAILTNFKPLETKQNSPFNTVFVGYCSELLNMDNIQNIIVQLCY